MVFLKIGIENIEWIIHIGEVVAGGFQEIFLINN